jgi:RNA polymerase sigma factor (sigma-70 family)
VLEGNDHAFRLLVEKYRNDVFRTIFAVLRDQKEAEDAAQEVFMKIYTSLPQYQNQGFKTWMTRIAVKHYTYDVWLQYVNDEINEKTKQELEDHLYACDQCLNHYLMAMEANE